MNPVQNQCASTLEKLRQIWEEVLQKPVTNIDNHFFDLGGNSMMALVVAARAQNEGISMPITGVLRMPTLRMLAAGIDEAP